MASVDIKCDQQRSDDVLSMVLVLGGINEPSVRPSMPSTLSSWAAQGITDG
jgi:hypothetical protein